MNINQLIVFLRISLFLYFETLRKKEDVITVYYIKNLNLEKTLNNFNLIEIISQIFNLDIYI